MAGSLCHKEDPMRLNKTEKETVKIHAKATLVLYYDVNSRTIILTVFFNRNNKANSC
jgi:hypothetical protein